MMKLSRFKVTNFRSVIDSGWIDCDDVTSLIGINEAGKSNVILALWKLKPVRDGEIDLLHDMPTRQYSSWRTNPEKIVFITAEFKLDSSLLDQIMPICGCDRNLISEVTIQRFYSKEYSVYFPNYTDSEYISSCRINNIMETAIEELEQLGEKTKSEAGIKSKTVEYYSAI